MIVMFLNNWRRSLGLVVTTGVVGFGLLAPTTALAGEGCDSSKGLLCGRAMNAVDSNRTFNAHDNWKDNDPVGTARIVEPGNWSTFKDTDGYCIPPNTRAFAFILGPLTKEKWWQTRTEIDYPVSTGWRCRKIGDPQIAFIFAFKPADAGKKIPAASSPNAPDWAGMRAKAKKAVKAKAVKVCKAAKKVAKNQGTKYYKKYKKPLGFCAKNFGVKVPKKK